MIEQWKDILNYEGLYQVSNLGNVKSLPKTGGNGGQTRLLKQEVIETNSSNYRRVTLSHSGKIKRYSVHRLVAEAFIPNVLKLPMVNHIDNNGENNHHLNLEWCTHSGNMLHAQKQGRLTDSQKKGGLVTKLQAKEYQEARFNSLLGNNFIRYFQETTVGKARSFIEFHCSNCGAIRKTRVDSHVVKTGNYLCKNCM